MFPVLRPTAASCGSGVSPPPTDNIAHHNSAGHSPGDRAGYSTHTRKLAKLGNIQANKIKLDVANMYIRQDGIISI